MKARLKIAYSDEAWSMIGEIKGRKSVRLEDCDLPEAAAVIITKKDRGIFRDPHLKAFGIPVFLIVQEGEELCEDVLGRRMAFWIFPGLRRNTTSVRSKVQPSSMRPGSCRLSSKV